MKASAVCARCGERASEHCDFLPVLVPDKCQCDPNNWLDPENIPPVCGSFAVDDDGLCGECSHPPECHEATGEPTVAIEETSP